MSAPRLKRFRVRFNETNFYTVDLKARDEEDAIERAKERYLDRAPDPTPKGFCLDISEGSLGDFEAECLTPAQGEQS